MVTKGKIQRKHEGPVIINKDRALRLLEQIPLDQLQEELTQYDPFIWIHKNIPTEYGSPLAFDRRPYLIDILKDYSPHIVYKKSAQVGITMCGGIAKCLFAVDTLGITSIYTFPTARDVNDFSKARFRFIVRNSRYLQSKIGDIDNAGMVRIGNSVIYFRGTWTNRQALSVPSHLNVHDELDFSDPGVRETYSSRLDAAEFDWHGEPQYGWEWDFSTPTLPKFGISALYDISDQHQWWVRCSGCNRRQRVSFFKNMRKHRKGPHYFGCLKCDKELDRTVGRWTARNPGAHIRGYHITQPMCAFINAEKLYTTWQTLKKDSKGIRKFHNFNLGIEYEDGTEALTRHLVLSRVTEGTVDNGSIFIGVDQGDILHVEVTKIIGKNIRRIIWIGTLSSFDELERLFDHYNPRVAVIDALPNHHDVLELTKKRHNVYAAYYGKEVNLERKYWKDDLANKEVKLPRTDLLDKTASQWHKGEVVIENYIPANFIEDFADQMSNAKRTFQENKEGDQKAVWVPVDDDHYRHADAYNWVATEIGKVGYSKKLVISKPDPELLAVQSVFSSEEVW